MAGVSLGLNLFSALTTIINSKFFLRVPHKIRIMVGILLSIAGLFIYGFSTLSHENYMFFVILGGAVLVGIGQSIG